MRLELFVLLLIVGILSSSAMAGAQNGSHDRYKGESQSNKEDLTAQQQFERGIAYSTGSGVEQSDLDAVRWIKRAAERNHAYAQFNLGEAYANGVGVAQDYGLAVKWLTMAAKMDVTDAQVSLGLKYDSGLGVGQNKSEAVKWFRQAAELGNPHGQNNLAIAYALGEGVEQSSIKAYAWFELAKMNTQANIGVVAEAHQTQISQKMSLAELSAARSLVEQWLLRIK
ncbi:MAG: hypothetical protein GQ470_01570 [Gammaproteobacteria bacterium]|nr:hypothetical protein [Gammaproteobacteria bacterium]